MEQNVNKGRILRVKTGYNPNSSSVGSDIPPFLAFAVASGAVTVIVMNIINNIDKYIRKNKSRLNKEE